MKNIVVVDIDGTIAKVSKERLNFLESGRTDWDAFYRMSFNDKPINEIIHLIWTIRISYRIVFCTGRSEIVRDATQKWLDSNDLKGKLIMRPNDCIIEDAEMKPQLLIDNGIDLNHIALAIDDKDSVVDKFRSLGIKCLQVERNKY